VLEKATVDWSEATIKRVYEGHLVGNEWPYLDGSKQDVEQYLRDVVADLGQSDLVSVEADFNHFGSGYASFLDFAQTDHRFLFGQQLL
jgi:hypothetical protein